MASAQDALSRADLLSVDCRPIRDVGNAVGISFDVDALRELGVVDQDGDVRDVEGRVIITSDAQITIDLDVDELDDVDATA